MKGHERVVVIGGSSGMGLEVAKKLLAAGAEVVVAGRAEERLHAARTTLGVDRVEAMAADIGERSQVAALFARGTGGSRGGHGGRSSLWTCRGSDRG